MVTDLESEMGKVFARIGSSPEALHGERLVQFITRQGRVPYESAIRFMHAHFPGAKEIENTIAGIIKSGLLRLEQSPDGRAYLAIPSATS